MDFSTLGCIRIHLVFQQGRYYVRLGSHHVYAQHIGYSAHRLQLQNIWDTVASAVLKIIVDYVNTTLCKREKAHFARYTNL